jgi:serine/threonine-protein kinase
MSSNTTRSLGKYRLLALLAQGGVGDIWLAVSNGPGGFSKLVVRISARLSHPHIVQTHEVGEDRGTLFIAMEYLEGQSLSRLRRRHLQTRETPLPLALELPVILATLRALEHAHELRDYDGAPLRIVHRDVSQQNVMVTYDGQIKLLDFGIAKALDTTEETRTGTIKGKISYMSPEQAVADDIDHRTDIFSAGVLLAEAIAGERFWPRLPQTRIFGRLVQGELPTLRDRAQKTPETLLKVCERSLMVDRDARYASVRDMRVELEAVLSAHPELHGGAQATAACLAEVFASERTGVRAYVDQQLQTLRGTEEASVHALVSLDALHRDTTSLPFAPVAVDSSSQLSRRSSLAPLATSVMPPGESSSALLPIMPSPGTAFFPVNVSPRRPVPLAWAAALGVIGVLVGMLLVGGIGGRRAGSMDLGRAPAMGPPASAEVLPSPTALCAPPPAPVATAAATSGEGAADASVAEPAASSNRAPPTFRPSPSPSPRATAPATARPQELDIRLSR